jgi:hypothetical protein
MVITCPQCQFTAQVSDAKLLDPAVSPACPRCGTAILRQPSAPPPAAPPAEASPRPEEKRFPWETRTSALDLGALWRTTREILFHPKAAFSSLTYDAGSRSALTYALVYGSLGQILGIYWGTLGGILDGTIETGTVETTLLFAGTALFTPIFLLIFLYVGAGLVHLFLKMLRGVRRPFAATFQVVAYVSGATSLVNLVPLNLVPVVGGMIISVLALVLNCIGLASAHQTSTGRALLALLLPLMLLVGVAILFVLLVAAVGFLGFIHPMLQPR